MSELVDNRFSPVEVAYYEYDYTPAARATQKFLCGMVLDTRDKRRILRHIERRVRKGENPENVRREVKQRTEEIAAWYKVTLR